MKIVSENSEEELRKTKQAQAAEIAKGEFESALRDLAANLMRIARGAGKGYEVTRQLRACVLALNDYQKASGFNFSDAEVSSMLPARMDVYGRGLSEAELEWACGIEAMMRGGLQLAAARLLNQRLQIASGESDLMDGMRAIERSRELHRAEWSKPKPKPRIPREPRKAAQSPEPPPPKPPSPKRGRSHKDTLAAYKAKRGLD